MASIQKTPDREKLLELLNYVGQNVMSFPTENFIEALADFLIENGVKVPVKCKDCQLRGSMDCPLEAYVPWYCTGDDGYCADGIRRSDGSE